MFRAPQALKFQFLIVLLGYKLHLYILPCLSLQNLSEYIYFCIYFANSSRTFVKKASKSHVSCTPNPFKSISERSIGFKLHIYMLPCLSLQDLSEYIYFCMKILNSSRTFVKKASKSHVSCTPSPLILISVRSIRF